ncbi:hypothetical protein E2542_SST25180 [Spatholobus suberectus]|nr:hypothetical protein E2542_SST25180 [Spatholobus suberectus]
MTSPAEEHSSSSSSKGEPTPPEPLKLKRGVKRKLLTDSDVGNEILAIEDGSSTSKKLAMFQRIWSEREILKVLAEFVADTGLEPYKEVYAFHDFLKKSKPHCVKSSTLQLNEKIRRMKKKFMNSTKGKSKSKFDFEILQLSQKVWPKKAGPAALEALQKRDVESEMRVLECEGKKMFGHGPMDEELWKRGIRCLDGPRWWNWRRSGRSCAWLR